MAQPPEAPAHTIGEGLSEEVIASEVNDGTALEMKEHAAEESDTDAEGSLVVAEVGEES